MIDKRKFEQKYNNFGYLSTKFWLKGNDNIYSVIWINHIQMLFNYTSVQIVLIFTALLLI